MTHTTLADALAALSKNTDLSARKKRDLMSAVSCIAEYLRRPAADIPTNATRLRRMLAGVHPVQAGVSAKTFGNVKANLAAALRSVGMLPEADPQVEITPDWEAFVSASQTPYHRIALARFINYCCVRFVGPASIELDVLDSFQSHLEETQLSRDPSELRREVTKAWNAVAALHGGKYPMLRLAASQRYRCAPLTAYPESIRAEIKSYIDRLSHADIFAEGGPDKPLRASSLRNIEAHLRQYFGALVEAGMRPEDMTSLRAVVTESNIKTAARTIRARHGRNEVPVGVHNITATLLGIARHHLKLEEQQLKAIQVIKAKVAPSITGMTSKNRERLGQLHDFQNVIRLVTLPSTLLGLALERPSYSTSPNRAMYAAAIMILLACPMRMKNLASLDIERHLTAHGTGGNRTYSIRIEATEVKNSVPIETQLNRKNSALLQTYLEQFRHRLTDVPSTALFPRTRSGKPRLEAHLGQAISREVDRYTGLQVNPHLFRHITAYLYLKERPGEFEAVRQMLKHKKLQTTMDFYAELSNQWAHDHYDKVVLSKWGAGDA